MSDATTNQAESLNQVGEATCSKRIMRYCLGKPLAPDGTDETQSVSDDDPSTGAAVPSFGRVSRWIIDDKRHETLWQFDIERLKRAAETSNVNHLRPAVEEDEMVSFSHINGGSFTQLGKVADQILYALWLFSYEDEAVLRDYGSLYLNHERGRNIFWNFERIKGHIPDLPRKTELHYMRDMDDSSEEDDEPSETPAMSQLVVTERDQYCYIVDEVTAILAHVAWNSSGSSYWRVVILACLAKISTKLKVLATQLPQAITKYVAEKKRQESDSDSDSDSEDKHPIVVNYCIEYIGVSTWLIECIEHVLRNLGAQKPLYERRNHLDICTLVYEAATRGLHTQVYQDKWASISGSTDRLVIHWALNSLEVASKLLQTLPPPSQGSSTVDRGDLTAVQATTTNALSSRIPTRVDKERKTKIQAIANMNNKPLARDIRNIMEFVLVTTPLSLASPLLGKGFADNLGTMSSRVEIYWGIPQQIELKNALFSMQRVERQSQDRTPTKLPPMEETTSLTLSWLVNHRNRPLGRRPPSTGSSAKQPDSDGTMVPGFPPRTDRERLKAITDGWVIQETSIVIQYPKYVNTVFGLTVILVVGGVICGLMVGSRVDGVDPFNFTMFSWILGGFTLLIAKRFRVSEWTWRDFLQRQVTCRSVCEVANVTELSQQEVLAYLLSSEKHHILRTSGPFQKVFTKDAVENGFSIDVSPDIQTLLASGIVTVKVLTVDGEALLWLRLIPGSGRVQHILVFGETDDTGMPVCVDLPQPGERSESLAFNRQEISWTKVLGVYNAVEKRIR